MRVLVTGAAGFAGTHLVERLTTGGHEVWGLVRPQEYSEQKPFRQLVGDLLEPESLAKALGQARPELIFHLAGQADVGLSWKLPALTIQVNTIGTVNLLEAIIAYGRPRMVAVTSADVYGPLPLEAMPINGISRPRPYHPYAVSKLAASEMLALYFQQYNLEIIEARPFNHIGPGQSLGFVVPDFASQIAAIKLGQTDAAIQVGNLDAQRDFCDVRDVVQAYKSIADNGLPGESYLICTGRPVPIYRLVDILADIAQVKPDIAYDPARMRPSDVPVLFGSAAKLQKQTGWQPKISLDESLQDVLAEWLIQLTQPKEIE